MPFTFKLSKRLALLKASLAAAVLAACERPLQIADPTQPSSSVVQVVVTPDTAILDPYQTRQFLSYGRTQAGESVAVAASWSASGGTVTASGAYTADTTSGTYQVSATASSAGVTGSAQVKNRGMVKQVIVTPAATTTLTGGTQQFAAYGRRANGDSVAVSVTYSATGGVISPAGLYTAGQTAGAYRVIAAQSGGTLADTAGVTISSVPVASVTVTPTIASMLMGATLQLTATPKDSLGNPLTGRAVTWSSDAPGVAGVSGTGLVTGLGVGGVTITATSGGHTGSSAVTVTLVADSMPLYTLGTGTNYYVAPSGSDANPCTAAAPCYTLARVSQLMSPGDNAHVAAGNYTWSWSGNQTHVSGTASAPISYISDTKWGAKIYGSGCDPIWTDGAYVQIINFDVTGNCSEGINVNGNYDKVIGNRVHDLPACTSGWCVGGIVNASNFSATGIQVIGNVVDNIAMNTTDATQQNTIHGIYLASPNSVVENNIVTRAIAACIELWHRASNEIVSNNVVANCGRYGIEIGGDPSVGTNVNSTVNNNIVVNVNGRGFHETNSSGDVFYNNIVYNDSPTFDLCCGTQSGTITLTSAQFSALFVNYTGDMTGDYHLQSGAVAIDAGTTRCAAGVASCVPPLDFVGIARPQGAAYDIGAYEY